MKLLLVEDDDRIIDFLVRGLVAEGHTMQVAKDGATGLDYAISGSWDVIILDLMLPRMDGREVCQELRKSNVQTPILMLTALETTQDVVRGLRMGADDYMTKPFAFDELVARLEVLHRQGQNVAEIGKNRLICEDIEFDLDALVVKRADEPITLTSLEYALLEFLMVESGQVLSRARILENVWGAYQDPLTNVVDVYVRRLREKLDPDRTRSLIDTIRGRGYRFKAVTRS